MQEEDNTIHNITQIAREHRQHVNSMSTIIGMNKNATRWRLCKVIDSLTLAGDNNLSTTWTVYTTLQITPIG